MPHRAVNSQIPLIPSLPPDCDSHFFKHQVQLPPSLTKLITDILPASLSLVCVIADLRVNLRQREMHARTGQEALLFKKSENVLCTCVNVCVRLFALRVKLL